MTTLRIAGIDGKSLSFDLRELLDALGEDAMRATWHCEVGDFVPADDAKYLVPAYDAATSIAGAILYQLASQTRQVIDGRFVATRDGSAEPWLTLLAVDSSWWEVTTDDPAVVQAIESSFRSVATD